MCTHLPLAPLPKSNPSPSPAVHHNGCISALKLLPDLLDELDQGRRLKRDSMVWPSSVLELLQREVSIRELRERRHVIANRRIQTYIQYIYGIWLLVPQENPEICCTKSACYYIRLHIYIFGECKLTLLSVISLTA